MEMSLGTIGSLSIAKSSCFEPSNMNDNMNIFAFCRWWKIGWTMRKNKKWRRNKTIIVLSLQ